MNETTSTRFSIKAAGFLLILPLVLFLLAVFFVPLAGMLRLAVEDTDLSSVMPLTVEAIETMGWNSAYRHRPSTTRSRWI